MKSNTSLAAATILVLVALAGPAPAESEIESHPWIGDPAPTFDLPTTTGETLSLEDLRGKYVVIHFGASW